MEMAVLGRDLRINELAFWREKPYNKLKLNKNNKNKYMNYRVSKKGFTLIELLIVISIIGILAVALLPNVLNAPKRARDAARKSDIATIVKAVETFNVDKGNYPPEFCTTSLAADSDLRSYFSGGNPPKDPSTGNGPTVPCAGGYLFCRKNGDKFSYVIATKLEGVGNNSNVSVVTGNCDGTAAYTADATSPTIYTVAQ